MTTETQAYYAGKNAGHWGVKPEFPADGALAESYRRGYRHARSEARLDADTEWDE